MGSEVTEQKSFIYIPGSGQYIGTRKEQQDAFAFSDLDDKVLIDCIGCVMVLADGMGGFSKGREASEIAVQQFMERYTAKGEKESIPQSIEAAVQAAAKAVLQLGRKEALEGQIGTTLIAVVLYQGALNWVSVGDSHIYLVRGGSMTCLNGDHVYAKELAEAAAGGKISVAQAKRHPERLFLTSYLGIEPLAEVEYSKKSMHLCPGDQVLLCSDGIYNSLNEEEFLDSICNDSEHTCQRIIEKIQGKRLPQQDNATVVSLFVK